MCQISFSGDAVEHVEGEERNIRQVEAIEEDMDGSYLQAPASIEEELNRIDDIMEEEAASHDEYEEMMERAAEEHEEMLEREAEMMERVAADHEEMLEREAEMVDRAAEEHEMMEHVVVEHEEMLEHEAEITERAAAAHQERMASAEVAQELDHVDYDIAIPSHHSYLGEPENHTFFIFKKNG